VKKLVKLMSCLFYINNVSYRNKKVEDASSGKAVVTVAEPGKIFLHCIGGYTDLSPFVKGHYLHFSKAISNNIVVFSQSLRKGLCDQQALGNSSFLYLIDQAFAFIEKSGIFCNQCCQRTLHLVMGYFDHKRVPGLRYLWVYGKEESSHENPCTQ